MSDTPTNSPTPPQAAASVNAELLAVAKAYATFTTCHRCRSGEMCEDCADAYAAIHQRAEAAIAAAESTAPTPPQAAADATAAPATGAFLILSNHRTMGNSVWLWWLQGGHGYSSDVTDAGRFTEAEARKIDGQSRGECVAVPEADALAVCRLVLPDDAGFALRDRYGKDGAK